MRQKIAKKLKKLANYTNKDSKALRKSWYKLNWKERTREHRKLSNFLMFAQSSMKRVERKKNIPTQRLLHDEPISKVRSTITKKESE